MIESRGSLTDEELIHLLKLGVIFLNYGDDSIQRLGYRIIVRYSNLNDEYRPLYDVAINKGFIPVSKFIEEHHFSIAETESFFKTYFSSYQDNFSQNGIYLSYGQKKLIEFSQATQGDFVLIAPTSYGKSEIIVNKVYQYLNQKICVIVPSKALLAQTKKRILNGVRGSDVGRIITHPEMYRGDEQSFVAVLTQERLLRLLQKNPKLRIDVALVDEAHNMLKKEERAVLLVQVMMILRKRNTSCKFNFFSPFISSALNLENPRSSYKLLTGRSEEFIKVERYFTCNTLSGNQLFFYDQFLNQFTELPSQRYQSDTQLILDKSAGKNIVYLNRPRDIVNFALRLSGIINTEISVAKIQEATTTIGDFLHPDYNLLKCIECGVVYHHGGMPELIRLYVESIFSDNKDLRYIITSSTLLEGVNIPAEKIFLLTNKIGRRIFTKSQFKNLIGRICRFSEVFDKQTGRLSMLEPEIYLIKSQYEAISANHASFLMTHAKSDIDLEDEVENILLKEETSLQTQVQRDELRKTLEYLENIEPDTVELPGMVYVDSQIAQLCFRNNVYDFNIAENEARLLNNIEEFGSNNKIIDTESLVNAIYAIFIYQIDVTSIALKRLENFPARRFYSMILNWRTQGSSYKEMITKFVGYWNSLEDKVVYFGSAWGEIKRNQEDFVENYIDLSQKSGAERVNLAILKIKEEQDFVEFNLLKYIEILFEIGLVEADYYEKIKYGTSDKRVISLLKNGFSIDLAKCITSADYAPFININTDTDIIEINGLIPEVMDANGENKLLIFEVRYHMRSLT
ncbi:DEAD/DEAH box helicase [Pedobacter jeongneungensis]